MAGPSPVARTPAASPKSRALSSKSPLVASPAMFTPASRRRVPAAKTTRVLAGVLAAKKLSLDAILARLPQPSTVGPAGVVKPPAAPSKRRAAPAKSSHEAPVGLSIRVTDPAVATTPRALPDAVVTNEGAVDATASHVSRPPTPVSAVVVKSTVSSSKRSAAPAKSRAAPPGPPTRVSKRRAAVSTKARALLGVLVANEEAVNANAGRLSLPSTPAPGAVTSQHEAQATVAPSKRGAMPAKSRSAPPGPPTRVSKQRAAAATKARALSGASVADEVVVDADAARLLRPPNPVPAVVVQPAVSSSRRRGASAKSPRLPPAASPAGVVKLASPLPPALSTTPANAVFVQNPSRSHTSRPLSAPAPPSRASKRLAALRDAARPAQGTAVLAVAMSALQPLRVASGLKPAPQAMVAALVDETVKVHSPVLKKGRQSKASSAAQVVKAPSTRVRRAPPRALQSVAARDMELGPVPGFLSDSQRAVRLAAAVAHLQQVAPQVARLLMVGFVPPFRRVPLFDALTRTILYQQVNGATAGVMYARIGALLYPDMSVISGGAEGSLECPPLTAHGVLDLGVDRVRGVGVSGVKARYILSAAEACARDGLDEFRLAQLDDEEVNTVLCALPGVGAWTAAMVRMFCLERQDVLPAGDLTLRRVAAALWGNPTTPAAEAERAAGRANSLTEAAAPRKEKVSAKAQAKTIDDARVKTVPLVTEAAASAQGRAKATKMMAFQSPLMADEDLERLLEVCRPFRSYAAWALWGVTDEFAFLPVGGVLKRPNDGFTF